jgi:hypothetical protein
MANTSYSRQGIGALPSGAMIGGTRIFTFGAAMSTVTVVPSRIGDILINTSTGKLYVAGGVAATTDWKLVTSA